MTNYEADAYRLVGAKSPKELFEKVAELQKDNIQLRSRVIWAISFIRTIREHLQGLRVDHIDEYIALNQDILENPIGNESYLKAASDVKS